MFSSDNQEQIDNYISAHYGGNEEDSPEKDETYESVSNSLRLVWQLLCLILRTLVEGGLASWNWAVSKW